MQVNDKSRSEFYQMLQEGHMPYGPNTRRSTLEAYAPVNDFARRELARDRAADMAIEGSRAEYETTRAEVFESAAAVTDTVGDVVTLGAHRNLQSAYEHAADGQRWEAAKQVVAGTGKIAVSAVLAAPQKAIGMVRSGLAARSMAGAGQGLKLASWPRAQRVIAAASQSRLAQGARSLVSGGVQRWKNAQTFLTNAGEAFSKSNFARSAPVRTAGTVAKGMKEMHEAQETTDKWNATLRKNQDQFHPKQAFQALGKLLQLNHTAHTGAALNHRV